jgi:uncharacterized repeat protein (TIGR03806 family)
MQTKLLRLAIPLLFLFAIILIPNSCKDKDNPGNELGIYFEQLPYENLSDYNFFKGNIADLTPEDRVVPYDLNTPLFTDYAQKSRFVWMPEGVSAGYSENDALDFPIGTILIKNFHYDNDFTNPSAGRKIIETRLLVRQDTAWQAITYVWNDEQTEAEFSLVGGDFPISWTHYDGTVKNTYYHIPNRNECTGCHNVDNVLLPMGPKSRNLNKNYAYTDGTMNQLEKWVEVDYLTDLPSLPSVPKAAVFDDVTGEIDFRARTYLDINCGHCHNPRGPAKNSGLTLTIEEDNPTEWGVCKTPVAAGQGSGGLQYGIVPGEPDNSILYYRMNSTELDVMMPELGRSVNHDEGLALIYEWISQLEGECE